MYVRMCVEGGRDYVVVQHRAAVWARQQQACCPACLLYQDVTPVHAAVPPLLVHTQLEGVVKETQALKERQETPDSPEALTCMPSLQVGAHRHAWEHNSCVARGISALRKNSHLGVKAS